MRKSTLQGITTERERRRKRAESVDEGNEWLATYGDLMSLLLVFFVLFYVFAVTGQLPLLSEALESYQQAFLPAELAGKEEAQSTLPPGELVIEIPSKVLFDLGRAELKPEAIPYLHDAVDSLKAVLAANPGAQVRVEGYTDDLPIHNWRYGSNWELSAAGAISVVRFLIEEESFPPESLQAMGYGEYNPIVPNDSPENRSRNRRVEIKVVMPPGARNHAARQAAARAPTPPSAEAG